MTATSLPDGLYRVVADPGNTCQCWFSINTGPNGECEKCGKVKVLPPHVPDAAPTSAGFVVAKTMPVADELTPKLNSAQEAALRAWVANFGGGLTKEVTAALAELDRLRAQAAEIERWQRFFSLVKEYATNPDSMRQKWGDWLNIPWVDSILAIQRERDAQLAAAHFIPGQSVAGPGFAAHLAEQIRKGT